MANITTQNPTSTLSRRNSIAATTVVIPPKLILPTTAAASTSSSSSATSSSRSFGSVDLELIKPSSSYTSLKDLLPSSVVDSPTPTSAASAQSQSGQIAIRNRLVKQAAWAYLQPMSTSPNSDAGSFFHRVWFKFSVEMSNNRLLRAVTRAFDWFLRLIRIRSSN